MENKKCSKSPTSHNINIAIENGPVEIVSFPMKNGGSFHSFLLVYQRVLGISELALKVNYWWENSL